MLSAGASHAVAHLVPSAIGKEQDFGHDVYVWGLNQDGQLGNGKRNNAAEPQLPLWSSFLGRPHNTVLRDLQICTTPRLISLEEGQEELKVVTQVKAGIDTTVIFDKIC